MHRGTRKEKGLDFGQMGSPSLLHHEALTAGFSAQIENPSPAFILIHYAGLFACLMNSKIVSACSLVGSPSPSVHPKSVWADTPTPSAILVAF
jgi:hypothetical protein